MLSNGSCWGTTLLNSLSDSATAWQKAKHFHIFYFSFPIYNAVILNPDAIAH